MNFACVKPFLISITILCLLTFLFLKTRSLNVKQHNQLVNQLHQLKQVDSALNTDILKSRFAVSTNYDPLVRSTTRLRDLVQELKAGLTPFTSEGNNEVKERFESLARVLAEKELLTEKFKSQNAVFQNSLHYFPTATNNLIASIPDSAQGQLLIPTLDQLLLITLIYNLSTGEELKPQVLAQIEALRLLRNRFPPEIATDIDIVIAHAQKIVQLKAQVNQLMLSLIQIPSTQRVDELFQAYSAYYEQASQQANLYRLYLYLSSVLLLVYIAHTLWELKREVVDRKRAEAALRESARRLREQNSVLMELARRKTIAPRDLYAALREITKASACTLEIERASVWLYNDERSKIHCIDLYERSLDRHSEGTELAATEYPAYFQALESERTIAAQDARTDPRTREFSEFYLSPLGISSMLDAPIWLGGQMVGVVCHEHVGPVRQWALEEQNFAGSIADFVSLAIKAYKRQQAEEALAKRQQYMAAVVEVERRLLACNRCDNCYIQVLEPLGSVSGASHVYVFENYKDEAAKLLMSQRAKWSAKRTRLEIDNVVLQNLSYDDLFPRWAQMLARGEMITGIVAGFPKSERTILEPQGILSILVLPLMVNNKFFGFISFVNCVEARVWDASEVDLLRAAASAIALALERQQAEEALRQAEAKYRSIFENTVEGIFQTTVDGRYISANPALARIYGYASPEELTASLCNIEQQLYVDPHRRAEFIHLVQQQGTVSEFESQVYCKDGRIIWISENAHTIRDASGKVLAYEGTVRDITERKQAEEDIRKALEKEKELSELKSNFVTTASHEFRTPLATILSSAELLRKYNHKLGEDQKLTQLQQIQTTVTHMTQLLNDVLLIGKAEAGKLEYNPAPLDLVQFCHALVEGMQLSATYSQDGASGHKISFCSQGQCTNASMDEKLLRHILTNLLSNAIKYSPQGGTVYLDLVCQPGEAIFQVRDEGIGIPATEQTKLFDSFYRASNVGTISGTGLGLAIVKKSVDLHGGTITVESEAGAGTTFIVTIPFNQQVSADDQDSSD